MIDFSLRLLLAHWPGRGLQASRECLTLISRTVSIASSQRAATARLCKKKKKNNISMRPLTGGLQKSKEA